MTGFDDRKRYEETRFKHDQELAFKARNRGNKIFGLWIAERLGLSGDEAASYAKDVVMADFEMPGRRRHLHQGEGRSRGQVDRPQRPHRWRSSCRSAARSRPSRSRRNDLADRAGKPVRRRRRTSVRARRNRPGRPPGRATRRARSRPRCGRSAARRVPSRPATAIGRRAAGAPTSDRSRPAEPERRRPTWRARATAQGVRPRPLPQADGLPRSGILLLVALTVTWGLNWPMMKLALQEVQPWAFRSLCLAVGGASLLALTRASGGAVRHSGRAPRARSRWWRCSTSPPGTCCRPMRCSIPAPGAPRSSATPCRCGRRLISVVALGARLTLRQGLALLLGMARAGDADRQRPRRWSAPRRSGPC